MDRLMQGVDEETGRPFVLFGKVKITTLPSGTFLVEDPSGHAPAEFADRAAALRAAGISEAQLRAAENREPESPIVAVRGLVSEVEARALRRIAARLNLTEEAMVRRAVAELILKYEP